MALQDDLERIAAAAAGYAAAGEEPPGVLAAETEHGRVHLCAYAAGDGHTWLALDDRGEPVTDRELVRHAASSSPCAKSQKERRGGSTSFTHASWRCWLTENPSGIDEAEEAVLALQQIIGGTPRLATADHLDEVGGATRRLEETLGAVACPRLPRR